MPDDAFIRIAVVTGVHGLTGRLKILITTDVKERFEEKKSVFIKINNRYKKHSIDKYAAHGGKTGLIKLDGINDRDAAAAFMGCGLYIEQAETEKTRSLLLKEESFYFYDIIGCDVYFRGGRFGAVTDIMETGAGEILIITDEKGKEFMVPFVESMVDTSEIRERRLIIHPVEGLIDI